MKTRWFLAVMFAAACLCTVFGICFVASVSTNEKTPLENEYHLLLDRSGWQFMLPDGPVPAVIGDTVEVSGGELTIEKAVFPEEMGENVLLFRNQRQGVTVTVEGETLFRLGAGERRFKLTAMGYCAVPLPEKGRAYTLEITFSNLEDGSCIVPEFYFGSVNDLLIFLCLTDIVTIVTIPLWVLLGVALAAMSVFLVWKKIPEYRVISLSLFLLCAACWSFTDMAFTSLLPLDMEVASTVSYYLMMLMPIPILFFIHWSCRYRRLRLLRPILAVLLCNILLQTALFLLNIVSMHQMLIVSQAFMVLMVIYGVVCAVLDYRTKPTEVGRIQILAFVLSAVMGFAAVLAYWARTAELNLYRTMFQATIFVFLAAMLGVLMFSLEQQRYQSKVKDAEINAYRVISTIDQLTGLSNRRAFDRQMEEIQNQPERFPDALLVFMDLNGLKYANDKFGHLTGDELIIAAGRCIDQGFEQVGHTYRIGGDEFAVIIEDMTVNTAACYDRMDRAIDTYNETSVVPLSIARGSCALVTAGGQRLSASNWKMFADKKMYEDKVIHRRSSAQGSAEDYLEIISSFVSAVDAKDSYTADHSERVGVLTDRICHLLGLSEPSTDQIHIAACLHDIGKIGIPDSILCKTDRLDDEEWRIMQSHTIVGEEIVKHTRAFFDVSQIIRHHHERMDGKGYPDRTAGSEIPLGSRIIAIADSIDAMTSSRSYRKAKPLSFCREELQKNMGLMYDPAITAIVLEHWSEVEEIVLSQPVKEPAPAAEPQKNPA